MSMQETPNPAPESTVVVPDKPDRVQPRPLSLTLERLTARATDRPLAPVRDPQAHPTAPPRPPGAARPRYIVESVPMGEMEAELARPEPLRAAASTVADAVSAIADAAPALTRQAQADIVDMKRAPATNTRFDCTPRLPPVRSFADPDRVQQASHAQRFPARSRLSPSQRAQQHRSVPAPRAQDGSYITYTVEPARTPRAESDPLDDVT